MSLLVLSTGSTAKRLKNTFKGNPNYVFKSFYPAVKHGPDKFVDNMCEEIKKGPLKDVTGVIGLTDTSSLLATLINQKMGFYSPQIHSLLNCQNKYYFRKLTYKELPLNTPNFNILPYQKSSKTVFDKLKNSKNEVFYKPVKGSLSYLSSVATCHKDLDIVLSKSKNLLIKKNSFYLKIVGLLGEEDFLKYKKYLFNLLAEQKVSGIQITVDGYVNFKGLVGFFGITKSSFLRNTLSFSRFDFPYSFSKNFDNQIYTLCKDIINLLSLRKSFFNIELMVNGRNIHIVELNPRPSSQFIYMFYKSLGKHPLNFALKDKPPLNTNPIKKSSIFILRKRKDALAKKVPSKKEINILEKKYDCEINLFIKEGKRLSSYPQDLYTFRYAEVKVYANTQKEITVKFKKIKNSLSFKFVS